MNPGLQQGVFQRLRDSAPVKRWLADFQSLSGLRLRLLPAGSPVPRRCLPEPAFCREARKHGACATCAEHQTGLIRRAEQQQGPRHAFCAANIVHIAVPVAVGGRPVAVLFGGRVRVKTGTATPFEQLLRRLGASHLQPVQRKRLQGCYNELSVFSRAQLAAATRMLETIAELIVSHIPWVPVPRVEPALVARAREIVQRHEGGRLTTESVARTLGVNPSYFCRVFRRATGLTFHAYLARTRVETAAAVLRNQDCSITAAGFAAGFQSSSDFNRVFKASLGMTPSEFRSRVRSSLFTFANGMRKVKR